VPERLCEDCGKPTGTEFYIVEDELGVLSVCHDCYELGKGFWLKARPHQETEGELEELRERTRSEFPEE
jgi:ribosome-binding protein aMBF1 (putative translation factor)